jgi:NodT family efflux transporter outer membrane factor (OMF) lipoprotein
VPRPFGVFCRKGGKPRTNSGRFLLAASLLPALLFAAGCKPVGPDYNRPAFNAPAAYKETGASSVVPPTAQPGVAWSSASPSDNMLRGKWWEIYQDPQLNQLEERIVVSNAQLRQATESYLAARDLVTSARADLYPTASSGISASRGRTSVNGPAFKPGASTSSDFLLNLQASWEPDFWGRVRRSVEAAGALAQADSADVASVDLSLHAELASGYFQLRGIDSQVALLNSTVADLERLLDLTQKRLAGGVATAVDVAQAQTQLDTVRAQLVELGVVRAQYEHAIGTLLNTDLSQFSIPSSPLNLALPKVPVGVPSQLLERRPDIAEAERLTDAANARVGIAVSAFYPNIGLGGTAGFESAHAGSWIQGPSYLWSLGAQAAELLFDAGQRHALTDSARHSYEAQAATYRDTVFQAFNDVEDQLSTLRILESESGIQQQAVDAAQHALDLSRQRYQGGVTSYLEVLTNETTLIDNQRTAISLTARQFVSSVGLVRSLGGGWDATQLPK